VLSQDPERVWSFAEKRKNTDLYDRDSPQVFLKMLSACGQSFTA